jgi:hypothetical protein
MNGQTDGQTDGQTEGQTDKRQTAYGQTDRLHPDRLHPDRRTDGWTDGRRVRQTADVQTDEQMDRKAGRQADRQTNTYKEREREREINKQTDQVYKPHTACQREERDIQMYIFLSNKQTIDPAIISVGCKASRPFTISFIVAPLINDFRNGQSVIDSIDIESQMADHY